jgi:hypothetical protein
LLHIFPPQKGWKIAAHLSLEIRKQHPCRNGLGANAPLYMLDCEGRSCGLGSKSLRSLKLFLVPLWVKIVLKMGF